MAKAWAIPAIKIIAICEGWTLLPDRDALWGCGKAGDVTLEDVLSMALGNHPHTQPLRA